MDYWCVIDLYVIFPLTNLSPFSVYGKVYDVTEWQESHPGGDFILQDNGGQDCSELFRSVQHSKDAMDIRSNFLIAKLKKRSKL